ncbi:pantetheine-phosphate adenylyltransferase [Aureimonas jatrophae]|uniref:Phosphopantetheine adenylyltransferase n=1 Tax=Aureimonas jatrophae TaxID=1166073 RepID=A0A1H0MG04_9HYPH|nr:pantetheine-phosphate adenylyltransferase [Aureimonas jatrophae]MBB3951074.1 pantetheine-phosphate adenylyltransferase [Aureimonas jatrophae]SDO79070.1 Phosphopantetheine adenylyltransferase [Aureimonas jatrophae]
MKTALYTGSFDPPTLGHLGVLQSALRLFDRVVVAIGVHPGKTPFLSADERARLLRACCDDPRMTVVFFDGLAIDEARRQGADAMVRGLRDGTDLDYEMQMSGMNGTMAPDIETVFLPARPELRPITATLVRQIAAMGGDVSSFVHPLVREALTSGISRR